MTFNHSTREAESGGFLGLRPAWSTKWVSGQPGLYRETLSRKTKQQKNKTKQNLQKSQALWLTPVTARQGRQEGKGAGCPQLRSKFEVRVSYCGEKMWQQSQDGTRDCSQVLWLVPDVLIRLKISHNHRENCACTPWCKIGPYDEWWFWPMDCCYMDWADGAWLRGYIRNCDWGRVGWCCFFLERLISGERFMHDVERFQNKLLWEERSVVALFCWSEQEATVY